MSVQTPLPAPHPPPQDQDLQDQHPQHQDKDNDRDHGETPSRLCIKFLKSPLTSQPHSYSYHTHTQPTPTLTPKYTPTQTNSIQIHLNRLEGERQRERVGGMRLVGGLGLGAHSGSGSGLKVEDEVKGDHIPQNLTQTTLEGPTVKPGEKLEEDELRLGGGFVPSRRKRRAFGFGSGRFGLGMGMGRSGTTNLLGSSSTPTSTSSTTPPPTTSSSTSTSPDHTDIPATLSRSKQPQENPYTLILRGCMDGRWKGEGNYRCTRIWPGREGSSGMHVGPPPTHSQTSRSGHHAGNKKSTTTSSHSARSTRPRRGASSTRASVESTSVGSRSKGAGESSANAPTSSGSGGKPLLVLPNFNLNGGGGPSPSPLRMAYSQPNSPEEGVAGSNQSLSTLLDVSRVIRASSESGLGGPGGTDSTGMNAGAGASRKRRRGSAVGDDESSEPNELGGRGETRSASSPPSKKMARSGLSTTTGLGSGVAGVRVSPRLSHAVPVIPDDMKKVAARSDGQGEDGSKSNDDEIADPMTPSGKRYTELNEQDKEAFRNTWPLEPMSGEEWDVKTNGKWATMTEVERTALKGDTDVERRRMIFAHLDGEDGKRTQSSGASQQTSGTSSDLGKALLKRELEAKKRREGRAVTYSPPGVAGDNDDGDDNNGTMAEPMELDPTVSEDGKRAGAGGTTMRRTLSHDTATLSRPKAPSRRGSGEPEVPVSMASSRSRREVGPPRHLRDYEAEIIV